MKIPSDVENLLAPIQTSVQVIPSNIERVLSTDKYTQISLHPKKGDESCGKVVKGLQNTLIQIHRPFCTPLHEDYVYSSRARRLKAQKSQTLPQYDPTSDLEGQGTQQSARIRRKARECSFNSAADSLSEMLPKRKRRAALGAQGARDGPFDVSQRTAENLQPSYLPGPDENKRPTKRSRSKRGVIDLTSDDEHCLPSSEIKKERFPTPQSSGDHSLRSDIPPTENSNYYIRLLDETRVLLKKQESRILELEATVHRLCEMSGLAAEILHHAHGTSEAGPPVKQEAMDDSTEDLVTNLGMIHPMNEMGAEPAPSTPASVNCSLVETQAVEEAFDQVHETREEFSTLMEKVDQDLRLSRKEKEDFELRWIDKLKRLLKKHKLEVLDLTEDLQNEFDVKVQECAEELKLSHDEELFPSNEWSAPAAKCDQNTSGAVASDDEAQDTRERQMSQANNNLEERDLEEISDNPSEYLSLEE